MTHKEFFALVRSYRLYIERYRQNPSDNTARILDTVAKEIDKFLISTKP